MRIRDIALRKNSITTLELVNIFAFVLNMSKEQLFVKADTEIEDKKVVEIEQLIESRRKGKPLAYITKKKEFFSETFYVDERVLVPRPETETLVEAAITIIGEKKRPISILDIGTGAGSIGLTIAKNTKQHVICTDISFDALKVAKINADILGVTNLVDFVCTDLLMGIKNGVMFDMVLANLPYIPCDACDDLMRDVKDFEPMIALNGGDGGTAIYERLINMLPYFLRKEGACVLCEIDGAKQALKICRGFMRLGMNAEVKTDLSGTERVVIGTWTNS